MSAVTSRLELLFELLARPTTVAFVRAHAAAPAGFDRENGSRQLVELEAALEEFSLVPEAVGARPHLTPAQRALELAQVNVSEPTRQLALILALKSRALLG
jgi:hypothetical protein